MKKLVKATGLLILMSFSVIFFSTNLSMRVQADSIDDYPVTREITEISDFDSIRKNFSINSGNATWQKNPNGEYWAQLTEDKQAQAGSVYLNSKVQLAHDFSVTGKIAIGLHKEKNADGLGIVFHTGEPNAIGKNGEYLGVGGLPNAIGFVLDTYKNTYDPENTFWPNVGTAKTDASGQMTRVSQGVAMPFPNYGLISDEQALHEIAYEFSYSASTREVIVRAYQTNMKFDGTPYPINWSAPLLSDSRTKLIIPKDVKELSFSMTASTGDVHNSQYVNIIKSALPRLITNTPVVTNENVKEKEITLELKDGQGRLYPEGSTVFVNKDTYTTDTNSRITIPMEPNKGDIPVKISVKAYAMESGYKYDAARSDEIDYTLKSTSIVNTLISFYDEKDQPMTDFPAIKTTNSEGTTINLDALAKGTVDKIKEKGYELAGVYTFSIVAGDQLIPDPTTFKVSADTPLVKYKFKKPAPKQLDTTIGFYDEGGKELVGFSAIKSTNSEGSTINLDAIAKTTVDKIIGQGYELIGVYGYSIGAWADQLIKDPTMFKVSSDIPLVKYKFKKPAPKQLDTTIGFYDEGGKELVGFSAIKSTNSEGSTINLDAIAKTTVDKIIGQGYELIGVYGYSIEAWADQLIKDPTMFKVSSDIPLVKYKFKKPAPKQITTGIGFYDEKGQPMPDFPVIKTTNDEGAMINLDALAKVTVDKIIGQGYELVGVYTFSVLTGEQLIKDPTAFKVSSDTPLVKYKFAKKIITTDVVFYDQESNSEIENSAIQFKGALGDKVNLLDVAEIKGKLTDLTDYNPVPVKATDLGNGDPINDMKNYVIGSGTKSVKLFLEKKIKTIVTTITLIDEKGDQIPDSQTVEITGDEGTAINLPEIPEVTAQLEKLTSYEPIGAQEFGSSNPITTYPSYTIGTAKYNIVQLILRKKTIKTNLYFFDEESKLLLTAPIEFSGSAGDTVNLLNDSQVPGVAAILKEKLKAYKPIGAAELSTGKAIDTYPNYTISTANGTAIKLILREQSKNILVQYIDEQTNQQIVGPTILTKIPGDTVNLRTEEEIAAKLKGKEFVNFTLTSAKDKANNSITDYIYQVTEDSDNEMIKLFFKKNTQKLTITFKDEDGEDLIPAVKPIVIEEAIDTEIELSQNKEVTKVVEDIKAQKYRLVEQPDDKIKITEKEQTVVYKFSGTFFIESAPSKMTFGNQRIKKGLFFIKVEKASFDAPLRIWDNRKKSKSWQVTATLQTPFTSTVDETQTLPKNVLQYKKEDNSTVPLNQGVAEVLANRTSNGTKNEYTLSDDWKSGQTGFQMEIPTKKIAVMGGYRAEILWQVGDTP